jgi:small subunit ribosomal protein S3
MSIKEIVSDAKLRVGVEEFLKKELKAAGFSEMKMVKTPLGVNLTLVVGHPGQVIGPGGRNIRELSDKLAANFGLKNPQISVTELENPMLDANVVATRIGEALERGIRYRRVLRLYMRRVKEAGAIGAQIRLAGKLTSERSRFEKYTFGYIPSTGEPKERQLRVATMNLLLPQGLLGIKVKILTPDAKFPDQVEVLKLKEEKVVTEKPASENTPSEEKPEGEKQKPELKEGEENAEEKA